MCAYIYIYIYHIVAYSFILFINCQGTKNVQGMNIHLAETVDKLTFKPLVFMVMCNIWFLEICDSSYHSKIDVPKDLLLPDTLMFLRWDGFPFESVPPELIPKNLIELHMCYSSLKQFGNAAKVCPLAHSLLF